jgi:antitoxin HigA-1
MSVPLLRTIDLDALQIFKPVVDFGGVTRAAEQLHRVPSNVATRLKQLEEGVGTKLFHPLKESIMAVTPIHPGEHLKEELDALDMSAAELARKLNVPTNRITHILNGRRGITGDTALRLSHFFGTSAEFWLNLQSLYDLRLA